jgi:hypothetical protein
MTTPNSEFAPRVHQLEKDMGILQEKQAQDRASIVKLSEEMDARTRKRESDNEKMLAMINQLDKSHALTEKLVEGIGGLAQTLKEVQAQQIEDREEASAWRASQDSKWSFYKGASWVLGGLFALGLAVIEGSHFFK